MGKQVMPGQMIWTTSRTAALEYSDCDESAKYYSECLNQVSQRLESSTESLSQGIITTVLGFLCHDSNVGKWDRWAVHMNGLERIMKLRGDFNHLDLDISLFILWYAERWAGIKDANLPQDGRSRIGRL